MSSTVPFMAWKTTSRDLVYCSVLEWHNQKLFPLSLSLWSFTLTLELLPLTIAFSSLFTLFSLSFHPLTLSPTRKKGPENDIHSHLLLFHLSAFFFSLSTWMRRKHPILILVLQTWPGLLSLHGSHFHPNIPSRFPSFFSSLLLPFFFSSLLYLPPFFTTRTEAFNQLTDSLLDWLKLMFFKRNPIEGREKETGSPIHGLFKWTHI